MKNLIICSILFFGGCQGSEKREALIMDIADGAVESRMYDMEVAENISFQAPLEKVEAKVMQEASISFEVEDLEAAEKDIKTLNQQYKARVVSMDQHGSTTRSTIYLTVEILPDSIERYLENLKGIAVYVDRQNISATDITEEYVDIAARLKNRKMVEERYRELLLKANKVEDILKVEKALQEIREEVEAAQARINYYDQKVAMSTVRLDFYEVTSIYQGEKQRSFFENLGEGLNNGWKHLLTFIIFVVNLWPFLIITSIMAYFLITWKKKRKVSRI